HAIAYQVAILLDRSGDQDDRLVQQFLMSVPLRDHGEQTSGDGRDARLPDAFFDAVIDEPLDVLVPQHVRAGGERRRRLTRDRARVLRLRDPGRETLADVQSAEAR